MATVVVVGGVNLDLTVQAGSRPGAGETVVGDGPVASSGGKGANQAVAVAYAGARARLCAVVGDDAAGGEQREQLRAAGVDVSAMRVATGTATGAAFIVVTPDGENSIVVGTGANALLSTDDVAAAVGDGRDIDVLLAQTEPGPAAVEAAAERARLSEVRFVLNAAPVAGLRAEVLRQCDPLVVNEHEAADLLREHHGPESGPGSTPGRELARALRDHLGCRSVVVSLGGQGACLAGRETDEHVWAPAVDVVDTTGAGDVLVGVIAARLAQGQDLLSATTDACATAARAVTHQGARGYLPS